MESEAGIEVLGARCDPPHRGRPPHLGQFSPKTTRPPPPTPLCRPPFLEGTPIGGKVDFWFFDTNSSLLIFDSYSKVLKFLTYLWLQIQKFLIFLIYFWLVCGSASQIRARSARKFFGILFWPQTFGKSCRKNKHVTHISFDSGSTFLIFYFWLAKIKIIKTL